MTQMKIAVPVVRLERTIPAPPHEVYGAWLDPELLQRWLAPGGITVKRADVEARVGGQFRIWHQDAGVDIGGFECEIAELIPNRRIVFRWGWVGPERTAGPVYDSLLTITFRAAPGSATALTLVHERLDDLAAAMPDVAGSVEFGWGLVLDKLTVMLRGCEKNPERPALCARRRQMRGAATSRCGGIGEELLRSRCCRPAHNPPGWIFSQPLREREI